jgi:signal transduction protein with GAF and PtsI domain
MSSPIRDSADRREPTAAAIRSRLSSAYERKDRQSRLCDEARSLIQDAIQQAVAMQEEAVAMRQRLWMQRLVQKRAGTGRDAALDSALDAALTVASADCANIQLIHPDRRGLVLKAQRGFEPPFLDFFAYVDDSHSACGVALRERRPVVVEDVTRSPIFAQTPGLAVMLGAGIRAVTSAPLIGSTGEILGMLSVHYRRPHAHLDSDLDRLQELASVIADLM